jgi:hypothetical protein
MPLFACLFAELFVCLMNVISNDHPRGTCAWFRHKEEDASFLNGFHIFFTSIVLVCDALQHGRMNDCHVLDSCKEVIDDLARTISSRFTSLLHITSDLKVIVTVGEQLQRRMEQHPDASIDWAPFEDMVEAVREEFDSIAKAPTRVLFTHT